MFHSRDDARVPFEQGRQLAALIPGTRFVALPGKNHILLEDEPAWQFFLAELQAFLDEPAASHQRTAGPLARLTEREREVLSLIASGMTDRQIADELSLSARTVGNHVKNILAKMDAPNHTAATTLAAKFILI